MTAIPVYSLPNVITAGGPIGSATTIPTITYDAKGRLTVVSTATISSVGSVPAVVVPFTQTAHGFVVGDVIRLSAPVFAALLSTDSFDRADNATIGSTNGAGTLDPRAWC